MEPMNDLQTVPLTAFESQAARMVRIIRYLAVGWAVSVIALVVLCIVSISYTEEAVTTTETVTSDVMQDADNYGTNVYAGGDYYDSYAKGDTDSYQDGDDYDEA